MRLRVLHVISDLGVGGAELMLQRLLARSRNESAVVSLKTVGPVGESIRALGIPVAALGMRGGVPDPRGPLRLARKIRELRPDLVQSWMYHADLMAGLALRLVPGVPGVPLLWNLRQSNLDPRLSKRTTLGTVRLCASLSHRLPRRIVCCSESAREVHAAMGYAAGKMVVIPNGFDLAAFRPNPAARAAVRRELSVPPEAPLVGLVGRFDPQKDHATFAHAAARLLVSHPGVHFLLCGEGIEWSNERLAGWMRAAGIAERVRLLGRRSDLPRLTAALDVASSSSAYGEGFPNVIGEAMACGVPVVATAVGDSARLARSCGWVVPPRDPDALAAAWRELLEMEPERRAELGAEGRRLIREHYTIEGVVERYDALHHEVWQESTPAARAAGAAVTV